MQTESRSLSYWFILASAFAGAALFFVFAVALVVQIIAGHGSPSGNILRIALAIASMLVGLFLLAVGTLYRMSFDDVRSNEYR